VNIKTGSAKQEHKLGETEQGSNPAQGRDPLINYQRKHVRKNITISICTEGNSGEKGGTRRQRDGRGDKGAVVSVHRKS